MVQYTPIQYSENQVNLWMYQMLKIRLDGKEQSVSIFTAGITQFFDKIPVKYDWSYIEDTGYNFLPYEKQNCTNY